MKTIVVGDIHGCYNELRDLILSLKKEGVYNKDTDKLIFLGDYIDRGEDSKKVIEFIRNLQENNDNVIALMGNHEDMLLNYYYGIDNNWTFNGHRETLNSYGGFSKQLENDVRWIKNLPLYYEDEHFIYVHAGVNVDKPITQQDRFTLLWIRDDFVYNEKKYDKRVIFGHTPTLFLSEGCKPVQTFANNIDIDTGCVFGGALTALVIEDEEVIGFHQIRKETKENTEENTETEYEQIKFEM